MLSRIIEAGHYYESKGPTAWSLAGWRVLEEIIGSNDASVLLVDDFHRLDEVNLAEVDLPVVEFNPEADYIIAESSLRDEAMKALELLKGLSRRSRAKVNGQGCWWCSNYRLTTPEGDPTCLLYDLGFNLWKRERAIEIVNILPEFYEGEQEALIRLSQKILPDLNFIVLEHDIMGNYHTIYE